MLGIFGPNDHHYQLFFVGVASGHDSSIKSFSQVIHRGCKPLPLLYKDLITPVGAASGRDSF
jgi:hypothetical protein